MEQQRMEQQRMEQQRMEQQRMEQQRMEQQRQIEEQNQRAAGMNQMSQMSQQSTQMSQQSFSQSSTSFSSSSQQTAVFESQEFGSGVMKGYKPKSEAEAQAAIAQEQMMKQMQMAQNNASANHEQFLKDTGIFGGITGDHNSLVEDDEQFDYKKHSVKSLVGHFSKVRPKSEIPVQYLPEQRLYGGEQGPSLNYLTANSESGSSTQSFAKSTMSRQDINSSRQEYEMRKQKQEQEVQPAMPAQPAAAAVEMRSKTEQSAEQRSMVKERRQSLSQALLMDPATTHANAGIIDPSAILRGTEAGAGENGTRSKSEGLLASNNQGESSLNKWDNHNTIARGWAGAKQNYHPVTFRSIYNVESQKA